MITFEDAPYTYEFDDFYVIYPSVPEWNETFKKIGGQKVKDNFEYSSNNNSEWMSSKDLKLWINDNKNTFVDIRIEMIPYGKQIISQNILMK